MPGKGPIITNPMTNEKRKLKRKFGARQVRKMFKQFNREAKAQHEAELAAANPAEPMGG